MAPWTSSAQPELPPQPYVMQSVVREGAHSTVCRGLDPATNTPVILKFFDADKQAVYLRELAAGFGFRHRRLVRCLDTFRTADGRGCIVYDYIAGGNLAQRLETSGPLGRDELLTCLDDLLAGLESLHDSGRIHCDIKPENVLVAPQDDAVRFVLGDLGAVCFVREARLGRHAIGTPAYMAPERFYDRFVFNSDLYSLGVLAFELATGCRPFAGSAAELTRAHLNAPPPLGLVADLELRDFIERLLEKNPQRRIPSASAARHVLRHMGSAMIEPSALVGPQAPRPAAVRPDIGDLGLHACETLDRAPRDILLLVHGDDVRFGLQFESHTEIHRPGGDPAPQMVLHSAPLQITDDGNIAYATGTRVVSVAPASQARRTLHQDCHGLTSFSVGSRRLVWYNGRGWHFVNLAAVSEIVVKCPNYLTPPASCVLRDGRYLTTEGAICNRVVVRDQQAQSLAEFNLDGPVLALTASARGALAVTLDAAHTKRYSLWRLDPDGQPQKIDLPAGLRHWTCANGCVFWLSAENRLGSYHFDGEAIDSGALPQAVAMFAVSHDHRYVCGAATIDRSRTRLWIWNNPGRP